MCNKMSYCFSPILLLMIIYFAQGQNSTDANTTITSVAAIVTTATDAQTNGSMVLSCPGDHIDPPNCTQCASNYEAKDGKCLKMKSELKPSLSTGRRILFILLACLLTTILIISMLVVYGRVNLRQRRRSLSNERNILDSSSPNTNNPNRLNNILRSIGWQNVNRRGRFNFFSTSNNNNNNSSGQHIQTESSRAPLNENPDEALLFDDPYADTGFNSSSANPYKPLTLAVT